MRHASKIYKTLFVLSLLSFGADILAQTMISGTVRDAKGQPIIGAAVMLKDNSMKGAVTDSEGRYRLDIPDGNIDNYLEASCLSYRSVSERIGSRNEINFILEDDTQQLEETVVVGYGYMRKNDLTGSISSVRIDQEQAARNTSLDQMLFGRAAGVEVITSSAAPDAGVSIRIRGVTSLNTSSEPLYVIDGIIMSDPATGSSSLLSGEIDEETNSLSGINPQDIENIQILKDASATAIYGASGANGVVLITTRQAEKAQPVLTFSAGFDVSVPNKRMDVLSFNEYVSMLNERTDSNSGVYLSRIFEDPEAMTGLKITPIDWQDEYINHGIRQRYFLSLSGRPKQANWYISMGYNSTDGIVHNTGSEQYTGRVSASSTLFGRLKMSAKVNLAYINSKAQQSAGSDASQISGSLIKSLVITRPYLPSSLEDLEDYEDGDLDEENKSTPASWFRDAYSTREEFRVTPALSADLRITDWLSFKSAAGGDFRSGERVKWKGGSVDRKNGPNAGISHTESYRWNWDNTLQFNKKLQRHSISTTLGMTMGRNYRNSQTLRGKAISQYKLQADNINSAQSATIFYEKLRDSHISFFARAIYNYDDRYVITATFREDGSSKFRGKNRFSAFPSAAAAWRISQEPWFDSNVISSLKLRLGWGMVGNSSLPAYQTYNTYGINTSGNHFNSSGTHIGIYPDTFSNINLKWETTRQWNAGCDFGLWNGRFTLTLDAYHKTTYDLLQSRNIPLASGFKTQWVNEGVITNRGFEITIDATPIETFAFEWNINGNISFNRNRLDDLGRSIDSHTIYLKKEQKQHERFYLGSSLGSSYISDPGTIFIEGHEIGLFYGYRTDGIVQNGQKGLPIGVSGKETKPGSINYVDMNGDKHIDENDRTVIGSAAPDFTYGLSTSLRYRQITLSAAFNGSFGNDILNANLGQYLDISSPACYNVLREAYHDRWTVDNPSQKHHSLDAVSNDERKFVTDRYIEDGSYFRMGSLSLSYDLPFKKNRFKIRQLSIGCSAQNLFIITSYSGWSPIVNSFSGNMNKMGVDFGSYPDCRTFCMDIKLTF